VALVDGGEQLQAPHHFWRVQTKVFPQTLELLFKFLSFVFTSVNHVRNDVGQLLGPWWVRARPDFDVRSEGKVTLLEVDVLHELDSREGVVFGRHEVLVLQQSFVESFAVLHVTGELFFTNETLLVRHNLNYNSIE